MSRWYWPMLKGAAFLAALLFTVVPVQLGYGQTPQASGPVKVRVEITDGGFNPNVIEVEQGKLVEITFVWAHVSHTQEEHIMVLEGYKLETDKVNSVNREATIQLIADKPGTFIFKCDLDCEVHDYLQKGELKVSRAGAGGASSSSSDGSASSPAFTPTKLTLTPSSIVTAGDTVVIMAVLKDAKGAPVPKAELRFGVAAAFAGTNGAMYLGSSKTDANGITYLYYRPSFTAPEQKITATFEGGGVYAESEQAVTLIEAGVPPPAINVDPIGLETVRHWAPWVLIAVVAIVWAVFAVIMGRTLALSRVRSKDKSS
ncbi:MAG: cupredoxin domain-containing protein [Chloroflexi bacterium]|nr:cupredoxin domain-containing protein [Chloroflexota bacterium]